MSRVASSGGIELMPSGGNVSRCVTFPRPRTLYGGGAGGAISAPPGSKSAMWAGRRSAAAIGAGMPTVKSAMVSATITATVSTGMGAAGPMESATAGVRACASASVAAAMLGHGRRADQNQGRDSGEK